MNDLIGIKLHGYEFMRCLRATNLIQIYAAKTLSNNTHVFIKYFPTPVSKDLYFIENFERETRLLRDLNSPFVTPLIDHWRDKNGAYLVTPYYRSLNARIARLKSHKQAFDLVVLRRIVDQVARGLSIIHQTNNVHGDIKPANILTNEQASKYYIAGDCLLTNFTVAKEIQSNVGSIEKTATPQYMAPEIWDREWSGHLMDIYSMGIMLFELITLRRPFEGHINELQMAHLDSPVPSVGQYRNMPHIDAVDAVIRRATAKKPQQRYQNIIELARDFRQALQDGGTEDLAEPTIIQPPRSKLTLSPPEAFEKEDETPTEKRPPYTQLEIIQRAFNNHKEIQLIGYGGMGEVYKGYHLTLQRYEAIKVLSQRLVELDHVFKQRFMSEARVMAKLRHDNIVQVYDSNDDHYHCFIRMEFVEGGNLEQLLRTLQKKSRKISLRYALPLIADVASALDYAYNQERMVHRDIKPSNILLRHTGSKSQPFKAVLTDFGIAKIREDERTSFIYTETGNVLGTWGYMPPEQMDDPRQVDRASDVYSLAVVTYQLLTGELPFSGMNPMAIMKSVLYDNIPDPREMVPSIPHYTVEAIFRALEKDPVKRFQTAGEFVRALKGK